MSAGRDEAAIRRRAAPATGLMATSAEAFKSSLTWGEEQNAEVIISCRACIDDTFLGDERGLHLCEGVARALKVAGIAPFHGRMVKGGANWQRAW